MPKNFGNNKSSGASTSRVLADETAYKRDPPKPIVQRDTPKGMQRVYPGGRPDYVNK